MKTGLLATFLLLVTVPAAAPQPAPAQGWEEYSYPDYAFSVAFPANPQVDTTTYQIADNRSVPARIYSVRQANVAFSMIVAELEGTNFEENAVVDHAINFTASQISPLRPFWYCSLTARASPEVLGEGDDQPSAHSGDRIWNVALGS